MIEAEEERMKERKANSKAKEQAHDSKAKEHDQKAATAAKKE
jgi:hypothetical protein